MQRARAIARCALLIGGDGISQGIRIERHHGIHPGLLIQCLYALQVIAR